MLKSPKIEVSTTEELRACRVCLVTDVKLFSIYEDHIDEAFVDVLGFPLSAWDGFPQHVCLWCRRLLMRYSQFKARGLQAQDLLKQALMHQHFISTDYIRNLDRLTLNLTHHLTIHTLPEPLELQHEEIKEEVAIDSDEFKVHLDNSLIDDDAVDDEMPIENDLASLKSEDSNDDIALSELHVPKKLVKKKTVKHKSVRKKKVKEEKREIRKRRKTERIRDEDFPEFEQEYNIDINILNREQQIEAMEARKMTDNYLNSLFKCDKCFKGFYTEATLNNHNIKHHDPSVGPHECELCLCRFRIPGILRRHLETHRLRFVCQQCGFTARDRSHAMTHSKEHKGLTYECQYCGESFKKRSTYGTHVRIQHPTNNKSCDVCGETFLGDLGLMMHKKKTHQKIPESGSSRCKNCGVQFESLYALTRHTALSVRGCADKRACTLCGEIFKSDALLHEHSQERHSTTETKCDECDMTFLTEASRSVHYERVHLKVKVRRRLPKTERKYGRYGDHFMCEMCGKKCQNNIALKYHIRSHTGEKPHACPHCPKHYSTPVALQYHIRSHTGDKPLVCPHCPLRYATHKGLQTHLLKHTGERPFKCTLCGKAFTQKTMLQKHKTVHTGEKPFSCDICGKAFTQSGSVHTHVKYVHKKLPAPPRNRGKRDKMQ